MNANHDLERRIADFYASEAPGRAPDWVLVAALATIDSTPQRRAPFGLPWRIPQMQTYAKVALGTAVAVVVAVAGLIALRPAPAPGPGATVSPSPTLASTALPTLSETFISDVHGLSVSYPTGWVVVQATEQWPSGLPLQESDFADVLDPPGGNAFILMTSQPLAGRGTDAWIADITAHADWGDTCPPTSEPVTIDGATGVLVAHCPDGEVWSAQVTAGGRGYLFVLYGLDRALFDEILASVQLQPEDAVDTSPGPSVGGG